VGRVAVCWVCGGGLLSPLVVGGGGPSSLFMGAGRAPSYLCGGRDLMCYVIESMYKQIK